LRKVLLAVAGLALAAVALGSPAVGDAPSGDWASGSGHVLLTDFSGSVEAGPNGENPIGSLTLTRGSVGADRC
jgi:hypothetical protein